LSYNSIFRRKPKLEPITLTFNLKNFERPRPHGMKSGASGSGWLLVTGRRGAVGMRSRASGVARLETSFADRAP